MASRGSEARAGHRALAAVLAGIACCRTPPPALLDGQEIARIEASDAPVGRLLRQRVAELDSRPDDAAAAAALATALEANALWEPAGRAWTRALALESEEIAWHHHRALCLRRAGDPGAALAELEALVRRAPDFAPAQLERGYLLLESGDGASATAAFERVIDLLPAEAAGHVGLGEALLRAGEHGRAVEVLREALARNLEDRSAHYLLGLALRALGRGEQARPHLEQGVGSRRAALPDPLDEALARDRLNLRDQLARAQQLTAAGDAAGAVSLLEPTFSDRSHNLDYLQTLASALIRAGQPERALTIVEQARRVEPSGFYPWVLAGEAWLALARPEPALEAADAAIALDAAIVTGHHLRARALDRLGRLEDALASYQTVLALDPAQAEAWLELAIVSFRLGRHGEAEAGFRAAMAANPRLSLSANLGLARSQLAQGQVELAARSLAACQDLEPANPAVMALAREIEVSGRSK